MTNVFAEPFVLAQLAPLSPAPSGSAGPGPGLGARISNDWSDTRTDRQAADRQARKSSIRKARAAVEKDWDRPSQTKAQRLAQASSKGTRDTGGLAERRSTLTSVQKAVAALADAPSDKDISEPEFRYIRELLRQRYPGAKLSEMLAEGARLEQMLIDDPVAAREALLAAYARLQPQNAFRMPEREHGIRGSVRRAQQDAADSADLKDWIAKFGKRLPAIMSELEFTDRELRRDLGGASARIAAMYGAPVVESEIAPYEAKQAAKAHAAHYQQRAERMHQGVCLAIEHGLLPSDAETLTEMAAVMQLPQFQHHPNDGLQTMQRAAQIVLHPEHKRITPGKTTARSSAGTKSIGGGSPNAGHSTPKRNQGGVRASIEMAMEA
jgi:hypothetical protein